MTNVIQFPKRDDNDDQPLDWSYDDQQQERPILRVRIDLPDSNQQTGGFAQGVVNLLVGFGLGVMVLIALGVL